MKLIVALLSLILISIDSHATEYDEYLGGAITYHVFNPNGVADRYDNKINSTGQLIANPMAGYRQVNVQGIEYTSTAVFGGQNSIGEAMLGIAYSSGFIVDSWRVGLIAGVYFQNNDKFLDRGITPIYIIPHPGVGPTPVLGAEFVKMFDLSSSTYILLNSMVSPIILNATVGIGWRL